MKESFKEMLQASFKSNDTEEWLDVHFTRPIGLVFALFWNKLGVHPNAITILSIFLGVGAGICFYYTDLWHNIAGVLLLMFANFCDSTDGQMARLTGKKTLIGRMLDGFSGDVWFFCIYVAFCLRMQGQQIPGMEQTWGIWIWVLGFVAGILCHSPQSSLSDYYRNIHLFFLKGKSGSELDNSAQQHKVYEEMREKKDWLGCLFFYNYTNYCRSQEKRTPKFQQFFKKYNEQRAVATDGQTESVRSAFLDGSRPLMKYTNILTFNTRAICIYITALLNCPWVYFLFEIIVMSILYVYVHMHRKHETLCEELTRKMEN